MFSLLPSASVAPGGFLQLWSQGIAIGLLGSWLDTQILSNRR